MHDNSLDPNGFKDDSDTDPFDQNTDYRYDANGNMVSDTNKNIKYILYNHLNLPTQINFGGLGNIYYLYDATGKKLRKIVNNNTANVETTYLDGFQYKNGIIQFFPTAEGYANRLNNKYENEGYTQIPKEALDTFSYVYNYTDHLGNIRLSYSVDPSTNVLKIVEENHYYPFGLKHNNYNSSRMLFAKEVVNERLRPLPPYMAMSYNYKYNGKEYQDELGLNMYDYGARNYDPALGRWMNIDPKAEQYRRWSTYNYCVNNPLIFTDPDGMGVKYIVGSDGKPVTRDASSPTGFSANMKNSTLQLAQAMLKTEAGAADFNAMMNDTKVGYDLRQNTKDANAKNFGTVRSSADGTSVVITVNTGRIKTMVDGVKKANNPVGKEKICDPTDPEGGASQEQADLVVGIAKNLPTKDAILAIGAAVVSHEKGHVENDSKNATFADPCEKELIPEQKETKVLRQTPQK